MSATLICPKISVVFITGNNLSLNGDMTRRTLTVELYMDGDPAERQIENHLDENRLLELRPTTLAALYALVREWAQSGKPMPTKLNSNFKVWSQIIGGIVEHAGYGSVTVTPTTLASVDPNTADMTTLMAKLFDERQAAAVTFAELVAIAGAHSLFPTMLAANDTQPRQANTALGRFLAAYDQRIFPNNLRFVIIGNGHSRRYALRRMEVLAAA